MKIVIAGAGEVGKHLARMLSNEDHDITVIDEDIRNVEIVKSFTDVYGVVGDPCRIEVLQEAHVSRSTLFIAVMPDESRNLIAATLAKNLGSKKCIARIDHEGYLNPDYKEIFIGMGIDYMFYPEDIAAKEIRTLLGNTATTEYMNFSKGKLAMVVFRLSAGAPVIGKTLMEVVAGQSKDLRYRTIAINRDGETIIPRGSERLKKNDLVYVITKKEFTDEVLEMSGQKSQKVKNVMILGGGAMGERVATELQDHMSVKLLEYNDARAKQLQELLDNTLVIYADGRDERIMEEENLRSMDAFIALTGRSETNILVAMMAKKAGVKKVIAEVENFNFIDVAERMGVDTIINKKLIAAGNIFKFTLNTDVQSIRCLSGSDAEVLEFIAKPGSLITKRAVRQLSLPEGAILGGGVRGEDKAFIVTGDTEIKAYDRVVVFALPEAVSGIARFFD